MTIIQSSTNDIMQGETRFFPIPDSYFNFNPMKYIAYFCELN